LLPLSELPKLSVGAQQWSVAPDSNLLDALLGAGVAVPYSCRAGSCHSCLVRCLRGEPQDAKPTALSAEQRAAGWRLACQCQIVDDLQIEVYDRVRHGLPARVEACDWLSPDVLRLRLHAPPGWQYRAGQQLMLCLDNGVARPYYLASLAEEDPWLEFHLECRQDDAFSAAARQLRVGDSLRLGELADGALHYDADWQLQPLWLMAAGTGLAPLYGVLREALRQGHQGTIRLIHLARPDQHYLNAALQALADGHPQLQIEYWKMADLPAALAELRLASRQTQALICGCPASVERFTRRLYLAGLPRNQMIAETLLASTD